MANNFQLPQTDSNMKKLLLLIASVVSFQFLSAQDEAIFTHYHITPILINPSTAGFSDQHQLQLNARAQWTGFTDAPKTYQAIYNGPIGNTFGFGIGVLNESAAQLNRTRVQLNYAFRFNIKEDWRLTTGFSTEFQRLSVSNDVANSNFFQAGDQLLEDFMDGRVVFDATAGIYGTFRDKTYAGLAFSNLVRSRLDDIVGSGDQQSFFQYYLFHLGHEFEVEDLNFNIEPSIMIRQIRNAPFQVDFNVKAGFLQDQLIAGLSYRSIGALGVLLGTKLSGFNLYYSYDVSFQRFQKFSMGSHEFSIAFGFKKKDRVAAERRQ
jgi:type IX secretion system PorP/SprF family membrane protein